SPRKSPPRESRQRKSWAQGEANPSWRTRFPSPRDLSGAWGPFSRDRGSRNHRGKLGKWSVPAGRARRCDGGGKARRGEAGQAGRAEADPVEGRAGVERGQRGEGQAQG